MDVKKTNIIIQIENPLLLSAFNVSLPSECETSFTARSYGLTNPAREAAPTQLTTEGVVPSYYPHFTCFILHLTIKVHYGTRDDISQDETEPEGKKIITVMLNKCMICQM